MRVRIVCPGYRDPLDQLFRDESADVSRKAQRSYKVSSDFGKNTTTLTQSATSPMHMARSTKAPRLIRGVSESCNRLAPSLTQSFIDVALAHFMCSYIPGSHFVYLPDLYNISDQDTALPTTVHAASLARLAWELGHPILMAEARRTYARALTKTNSALSDPSIAVTDAILISVLLLSLYETIICAEAGTPDNWTKHTQGALALIQLRGKQQLTTEVGRMLFTQVANIIAVDSMRAGTRLPPDLVELQQAALHYTNESPRFGMSSSTGELANLLSDVRNGHMTPLGVVEATQRLEAKLVAFVTSLPDHWQFQTEPLDTARLDVYGTMVHRYISTGAARFWNSYRMTRISLNGIMHGHVRHLQPPNELLLRQTERNVNQMAAEICASVPQFADPKNFSVASAASLLWPLSTVRSAHLVGQDMRDYAEERLAFLGRGLSIPQAEKVASCREVDALQDGLHMFYLS